MAINKTDKIFIDTNEEINIVVEKVLSSESERVILIAPQNSLVISSLVSMKILAKQVTRSKHLLVLVTEDAFGLGLAEQAGIASTKKVSNITPELWEQALILKERFKGEIAEIKQKLLVERGILPVENQSQQGPVTKGEVDDSSQSIEEKVAEGELSNKEEESQVEEETRPLKTEDEPEVVIPIQRRRRDPKLISLGGFELLAGGDISSYSIEQESGNIGAKQEVNNMQSSETEKKDRVPVSPAVSGFTGKDWTKYTGKADTGFNLKEFFGNLFGGGVSRSTPSEKSQRKNRFRRLLIIGIIVVAVLMLLLGYVFAFQLSSAEIRLSIKTAEIPVEQQIKADSQITEVDLEQLIIPAQTIVEDSLSNSDSGTASGEGEKGERATGLIEIWNNTDKIVKLKAGIKLENISSGLVYLLKQDVEIPAAETDPDNPDLVQSPGGVGLEVRIEAEGFGEQYNLTEPGSGVDFKVSSHPTADIIGKRFRSVEGGTVTTFVAVSEEDVDVIHDKLVKRLKEQGFDLIKESVPNGFVYIPGSEKFVETETSSVPAIGEEGDSFSVSVEGKVTAFVVAKADLESAVSQIILNSQESDAGLQFEVDNLDDIVPTDVVRTGNTVTFKAVSKGSLRSKITEDEIKNGLAGMSITEAEDYLTELEEVDAHKIIFSPAFVPETIQRIPTDLNRIKIVW